MATVAVTHSLGGSRRLCTASSVSSMSTSTGRSVPKRLSPGSFSHVMVGSSDVVVLDDGSVGAGAGRLGSGSGSAQASRQSGGSARYRTRTWCSVGRQEADRLPKSSETSTRAATAKPGSVRATTHRKKPW